MIQKWLLNDKFVLKNFALLRLALLGRWLHALIKMGFRLCSAGTSGNASFWSTLQQVVLVGSHKHGFSTMELGSGRMARCLCKELEVSYVDATHRCHGYSSSSWSRRWRLHTRGGKTQKLDGLGACSHGARHTVRCWHNGLVKPLSGGRQGGPWKKWTIFQAIQRFVIGIRVTLVITEQKVVSESSLRSAIKSKCYTSKRESVKHLVWKNTKHSPALLRAGVKWLAADMPRLPWLK